MRLRFELIISVSSKSPRPLLCFTNVEKHVGSETSYCLAQLLTIQGKYPLLQSDDGWFSPCSASPVPRSANERSDPVTIKTRHRILFSLHLNLLPRQTTIAARLAENDPVRKITPWKKSEVRRNGLPCRRSCCPWTTTEGRYPITVRHPD